MNQLETEQARKLLQVIRALQPSFVVTQNSVTIKQASGSSLTIPLSQRTIVSDRTISSR